MTTRYRFNQTMGLLSTAWIVIAIVQCLGVPSFADDNNQSCASSTQTRQLDFWLGKWTEGSDKHTSTVSLSLDKCMFVEHWENGKGHVTDKMFGYSFEEKNWYGLFADNDGRVHIFLDGKVSPEMAEFHGPSKGPNGETVFNRLKVIRISADKIQEVWEKSTDNGAHWTEAYRADYSRAAP